MTPLDATTFGGNPETVKELLARWDAGHTIWSIEMGGLGQGYEQAIQVAAIEFARACQDMTDLKPDDKESTHQFTEACNARLTEIDDNLGGLSGAQFSAARWLAWKWVVDGPGKFQAKIKAEKPDRAIQVSKTWPRVEPVKES